MKKKKISVVIIAALLVGLLVIAGGCGKSSKEDETLDLGGKAQSSNYSKWNGKYVCSKEDTYDGETTYDDVVVEIEDGYISITLLHYDEVGDKTEDNIECDYTEKEDGKAIYAKDDYNLYELRKLSGKYILKELDSFGDVSEKYDLTKGGELPTHIYEKKTTAVEETDPPKKVVKKKAKKKAKKKKSSGVSSSLKEVMDEYEDFVDDYVDFMKEYSNASVTDQAGMMQDYTDMLGEYSEWSSKVAGMDSDLSSSDLAYYNKVIGRCAKKLAEVGQ